MKYFTFAFAIVLVGAGCGSSSAPAADTGSRLDTQPASTSTRQVKIIEEAVPEVSVQNFGNVTYAPTIVSLATIPESKYEMDWQGWWKVGEDVPGRAVYVLIEGSDEYFYASNADRSVETRGHWKVSTGGALTVEAPERVFTTFKQGVMVDDTTAYVLRGHTWEKWESITDPMLP